MATIAGEIERLQTAKASIKSSIESKDIEIPNNAKIDSYYEYVTDIPLISDYIDGDIPVGTTYVPGIAQIIKKIPGNLSFATSDGTYAFRNCYALEDVSLLDTSNLTNLSGFFNNCTSLEFVHIANMLFKLSFDKLVHPENISVKLVALEVSS